MRALLPLRALIALGAGASLMPAASAHPPQGLAVPFTRLTNVEGSGFQTAGQFMVRNRVEWHRTWLKVQERREPYTPLPEINFDKYIMLVATRGVIGISGPRILIESVVETDKALHVSVLRETFGTCYAGEGYSYPTDAILMPKTEKQIRWSYRDEIVDCPGAALP